MTTDFASQMQKLQFDALVAMIGERNSKVAKINAAKGDRDAVFDSIAESNDDEQIVNLRVKIAELQDEFDALVNAVVETTLGEATENADGLLDEVKEIDQTVRAGVSYYKKLYGDDAASDLPKVVRLKGTSSGGGGGRRIRGFNVIVAIDGGDETEFDNFAGAAKHLGVDTASLQEQFFAKAGVEKIKDAPDEVTFGLSWTETDEDDNETSHSATVTAYRTGPSGVAPKAEEPSDEPEDDDEDESDEDETESDEDEFSDL